MFFIIFHFFSVDISLAEVSLNIIKKKSSKTYAKHLTLFWLLKELSWHKTWFKLIKTCQTVVKTAMPKNSQMFTGSWEGTVKGQKLMPKICPVKVGTWPATWYLIFMFMVTYFAAQTTRAEECCYHYQNIGYWIDALCIQAWGW